MGITEKNLEKNWIFVLTGTIIDDRIHFALTEMRR